MERVELFYLNLNLNLKCSTTTESSQIFVRSFHSQLNFLCSNEKFFVRLNLKCCFVIEDESRRIREGAKYSTERIIFLLRKKSLIFFKALDVLLSQLTQLN